VLRFLGFEAKLVPSPVGTYRCPGDGGGLGFDLGRGYGDGLGFGIEHREGDSLLTTWWPSSSG
jgi:hypothetical protein